MDLIFSIVIPALNEEKLLPRLLKSLKIQTYNNFEVILVDANSNDKTVFEAQKFRKELKMRILTTSRHNVSDSRNLGAKMAHGKYLVFIDADNYIHPDFLNNLEKLLIKNHYDLVIPAIEPDKEGLIYKLICYFINFSVSITRRLGISHTTGGNLIIEKGIFMSLKGFDQTIFVSEDQDIVKRAYDKGYSINFTYKSKVVFSVRRFEKEGPFLLIKYFISSFYTALFGKITKKIYSYKMGGDYYRK